MGVSSPHIATMMSPGRVEVLFILGYELCAAFIKKHALHLFMGFMSRVVGYLIKFLAASGFFPWLKSLGGWVSSCPCTSLAIPNYYPPRDCLQYLCRRSGSAHFRCISYNFEFTVSQYSTKNI